MKPSRSVFSVGFNLFTATLALAVMLAAFSATAVAQDQENEQAAAAEISDGPQPNAIKAFFDDVNQQLEVVDQWFGKWVVEPLGSVIFNGFWTGDWVDTDGVEHEGWLGTQVPFIVVIPESVLSGEKVGAVLQYGHGLLGSHEEVTWGGHSYLPELADRYGYVIIAVDWTGMKEKDIAHLAEVAGRHAKDPKVAKRAYAIAIAQYTGMGKQEEAERISQATTAIST